MCVFTSVPKDKVREGTSIREVVMGPLIQPLPLGKTHHHDKQTTY